MKNKISFFLLVLSGLFFSCEKEDFNFESDFDKSYKSLQSFRESSGNSYQFVISRGSIFGGASETSITVQEGKITERHFKYTDTTGLNPDIPVAALEWTENESEIGTHEGTAAATAKTLDQVYDLAQTEWLIKRDNAKSYFEVDNEGLIARCGYVIDGCQDDCFNGIVIKKIEAL